MLSSFSVAVVAVESRPAGAAATVCRGHRRLCLLLRLPLFLAAAAMESRRHHFFPLFLGPDPRLTDAGIAVTVTVLQTGLMWSKETELIPSVASKIGFVDDEGALYPVTARRNGLGCFWSLSYKRSMFLGKARY